MKQYTAILNAIQKGISEAIDFSFDDEELPMKKKKRTDSDTLLQLKHLLIKEVLDDSNMKIDDKYDKIIDLYNEYGAKYIVFSKNEIHNIIIPFIRGVSNECNFNWLDVSNVTDMNFLFSDKWPVNLFDGDISKWDVSGCKDFRGMFANKDCKFSGKNGSIANWNVSSAQTMLYMFAYNKLFNNDISNWNVSNCKNFARMFLFTNFQLDLSKWNMKVANPFAHTEMFRDCPLVSDKYPTISYTDTYWQGKKWTNLG